MAEVGAAADLDERQRLDATRRHALAMEAIGLIRTALHLQRPVFEALIEAERGARDLVGGLPAGGRRSFDIQVRMAKAAISFMHELDALADETLELAQKEKRDG